MTDSIFINSKGRRNEAFKKFIKTLLIFVIGAAAALLVVKFVSMQQQIDDLKNKTDDISGTLSSTFTKKGNLVTMVYNYEDYRIDTSENEYVNLFKDVNAIEYSGEIGYGINLRKINKDDIFVMGNQIVINLPEPKLIYNEIDEDSIKVETVRDSIFVNETYDDYAEVINEEKTAQQKKLKNSKKFMKAVNDNTEDVLTDFVLSIVGDSYNVTFR